MTSANTRRVRVRPGALEHAEEADGAYDVVVASGAASELARLLGEAGVEVSGGGGARSAFVVADSGLNPSQVESVRRSLGAGGLRTAVHAIQAREDQKTLDSVRQLMVAMAQFGLERGDVAIALGGGVVGDVGGFAAATYHRGVPLVQVPTTLLSMVDASVGGKTGVNLPIGASLKKNLVGAFHQPKLVVADPAMLATLPTRHLRAGLAECLKHGLLSAAFGDPNLFDWTLSRLTEILALNPAAIEELIARNVAVKAAVVQQDPLETYKDGGRALLNLGHTYAHAIETLSHLSPDGNTAHAPLHHGEAVGLGLVAASHAAQALGIGDKHLTQRIGDALSRVGLPTRVVSLPPDEALLQLMAHDKKVAQGKLRLIVPEGAGHARVVTDPPRSAVLAGWTAIRA